MATDRPKKQQRISQACDLCHRRSIRCRPSTESANTHCQNCFDFGVDCTYNRPSRRHRNSSLAQTASHNGPHTQHSVTETSPRSAGSRTHESARGSVSAPFNTTTRAGQPDFTGAYVSIREGAQEDIVSVAWRSFAYASLSCIDYHMQIYMDVVYPLYPLFHGPTTLDRLKKKDHLQDRAFFASIMAACSIAAARARDGAIGDTYHPGLTCPERSSEIFFSAAQDAIPKDLGLAQGHGYLRATILLGLTCIQYGQIKSMHHHLGIYHALSAMQHFHNELHWPKGISVVEKEERRRLFWAAYTLDIYSSVVFDSLMRSQETHSNVRYPSEINDEDITPGIGSPTNSHNWLRGWNFATDLYRVLEHSIKRRRRQHQIRDDRISITRILIADGVPEHHIMQNVLELYRKLPGQFKDGAMPFTGDKSKDLSGFQAAQIQATLQLVRMTLFSTGNTHGVDAKCDVAEEVLRVFHNIAPQYLRAISTPLVYHLGSIGQILASVLEETLSDDSYSRVRRLLGSMADLLEGLETGLQPTAGASQDLRKQIEKIDQYMSAQRLRMLSAPQSNQPQGHLQQAQQYSRPTSSSTNAADIGVPNGWYSKHELPQHIPSDIMVMNEMPAPPSLREFQFPPELVSGTSWPWPFELGVPPEGHMPLLAGYEQ
ncbi:hypothetical protein EJ03DRAFT_324130 [Teratosphaeria nubilosa]|uniref:Zn(2)-C6 fungal-type domain-containing protein n=1 Tax=Teratosphaeria nubilosa TaxID=161662 RepID=A0A6G1LJK0_9PEZI|nr:hypothetical protein EJ03DRAFT_324130 [Teratosphaeria nubilosa]